MCGIFGVILNNNENIYGQIIDALVQLQNRGYDSSGLSVLKNKEFDVIKYASTNELSSIDKLLSLHLQSNTEDIVSHGIGHNRWATHGKKTDQNAHPHVSNDKKICIVHNGIIENYIILKHFLQEKGFTFYSQTDTEVITNLISFYYLTEKDICKAIEITINKLQGTYGLIIQCIDFPNALFCVRNGSPLLIGENEECVIITSEQSGFCNNVNTYITLKNDDICTIEKKKNEFIVKTKHIYSHKAINIVNTDLTPYPYDHWTIKEINEQPNVVIQSINNGGRIKNHCEVKLGGLESFTNILKHINKIVTPKIN